MLYVPLDERPCNYRYPQQLAQLTDVNLRVPPDTMLGRKKSPADTKQLQQWLTAECGRSSHLILSIDMLVYGGILPSRLHQLSREQCAERLETLREVKRINPAIRIFAFNLIMRTPAYNSSEEEPDFYAQYGERIFQYGWLTDKRESSGLTEEEVDELAEIKTVIPPQILNAFLERRQVNAFVNRTSLELVEAGIIECMVFPQDDNAKYGFTSMEQKALFLKVDEKQLFHKVFIYPGADEVGCTLFARAFCELKQYRPEAWVQYSSTLGPTVIPKYEDRSLHESVKSQLLIAGANLGDDAVHSDFVLMIHSPAVGEKQMAETSDDLADRHKSYFSEINFKALASAIEKYVSKGMTVSLADVAVCNGGDHVLMKLLSANGLLPALSAYAGWNTSGNTLGTVIAHSVIVAYYKQQNKKVDHHFLLYRFIEDWGYQTIVREEICAHHLEALGGSYFELEAVKEPVLQLIRQQLQAFVRQYLPEYDQVEISNLDLPWNRMFELSFDLKRRNSS